MCGTLMIDEMSDAGSYHWVYGLRWSLMWAIQVYTTSTKAVCGQPFIKRYHISMIYEFSVDMSGTFWTFWHSILNKNTNSLQKRVVVLV